ncbi:MAG TPA: hypothetical protein DCL77_02630 [Prolixibacteraceae bacterium]|jgi:hypothetical protein|nr:hypothetical protein [Prolixibacteraceae bacterium]
MNEILKGLNVNSHRCNLWKGFNNNVLNDIEPQPMSGRRAFRVRVRGGIISPEMHSGLFIFNHLVVSSFFSKVLTESFFGQCAV